MNTEQIGIIVRERRRELGLTQAYLAAISGTGIRFVIELEKGKPTLQLEKVLTVLKVLNLDLTLDVEYESEK